MRSSLALLAIPLAACLPNKDDGSTGSSVTEKPDPHGPPILCDDQHVDDGTALPYELELIGYGDAAFDEDLMADGPQVVTDPTAWDTLVARLNTTVSLAPDFSSDAVFVHPWSDGGCEPMFEYDAIGWSDAVRVRAWQAGEDAGCDAYFPNVDLILVDLGGATNLGFCFNE